MNEEPRAEVAEGPVRLAVRPEAIGIEPDTATAPAGTVRDVARERHVLGDHYGHVVQVGSARIAVQTSQPTIASAPLLRLPAGCRIFGPDVAPDPAPVGAGDGPTAKEHT
jgi:hypothetical protein